MSLRSEMPSVSDPLIWATGQLGLGRDCFQHKQGSKSRDSKGCSSLLRHRQTKKMLPEHSVSWVPLLPAHLMRDKPCPLSQQKLDWLQETVMDTAPNCHNKRDKRKISSRLCVSVWAHARLCVCVLIGAPQQRQSKHILWSCVWNPQFVSLAWTGFGLCLYYNHGYSDHHYYFFFLNGRKNRSKGKQGPSGSPRVSVQWRLTGTSRSHKQPSLTNVFLLMEFGREKAQHAYPPGLSRQKPRALASVKMCAFCCLGLQAWTSASASAANKGSQLFPRSFSSSFLGTPTWTLETNLTKDRLRE